MLPFSQNQKLMHVEEESTTEQGLDAACKEIRQSLIENDNRSSEPKYDSASEFAEHFFADIKKESERLKNKMDFLMPSQSRTSDEEEAFIRKELNFDEDPTGLTFETQRKLCIYLIFKGKVQV